MGRAAPRRLPRHVCQLPDRQGEQSLSRALRKQTRVAARSLVREAMTIHDDPSTTWTHDFASILLSLLEPGDIYLRPGSITKVSGER